MAFTPAIYVDHRRCIGCNACSLACKQENNFENSPAVVAGARRTMAANERWNEVYLNEKESYPTVKPQVIAITFEGCTMCAHRLAAGLLPACVITCMGITREFGDYAALRTKYPEADHMEEGAKEEILYGRLGEPGGGIPGAIPANDCRQCHH